jgi:hypothetical protein
MFTDTEYQFAIYRDLLDTAAALSSGTFAKEIEPEVLRAGEFLNDQILAIEEKGYQLIKFMVEDWGGDEAVEYIESEARADEAGTGVISPAYILCLRAFEIDCLLDWVDAAEQEIEKEAQPVGQFRGFENQVFRGDMQ